MTLSLLLPALEEEPCTPSELAGVENVGIVGRYMALSRAVARAMVSIRTFIT